MTADAASGAASGPGTIDVIVVASWFPSVDNPADGRFVADQAEALAATGVARVAVVTFETARLSGGPTSRGHQATAIIDETVDAVAAEPPFRAPAWAVEPALAVARMAIPDGLTAAAGPAHTAAHRRAVLRALGQRLVREGGAGRRGIVHAHTVYPDGAAAIGLADELGWPLVVTEHSSFVAKLLAEPAIHERYAATVAEAHRVIAVSETLASELRSYFPDRADRIIVVPNAVPLDLFRVTPAAARAVDELLFVGYRKPSKGIENLLRAVAIARAVRPTITLRLIGRSPDEATETKWHALVSTLGLAGAVTFEEAADRAGIADAMARACLFVHPSPRETFGVVVVEALASGLPVVATDSGGVSEILGPDPDRLGALVAADDPEVLGRAIIATLDRRLDLVPDKLRASVERRFDSPFVAERLLLLYREARAGAAGGGDDTRFAIGRSGTDPAHTTIVVALDRERAAARLARLPGALRDSVVVVTAATPGSIVLPSVGRLVEVDIDTRWRRDPAAPAATRRRGLAGRIARLVNDPGATVRRMAGRDAGSVRALAPAGLAVESLARGLAAKGSVEILALDGHDHVAAVQAVRAGHASMAAGGLGRLADDWLASAGKSLPGEHDADAPGPPA